MAFVRTMAQTDRLGTVPWVKTPPERLSSDEEQALLQACKRQEASAWMRMYLTHRSSVQKMLFRVLGSVNEMEDLVQAVFMRVHGGLDRFDGRSRLVTWICGIATHVALEYIRKRKRLGISEDHEIESHPSPQADPSEQLQQKRVMTRFQESLHKLAEDKRMAFVLHDLMEVPGPEIAFMLNVPEATVRTRLFHARKELARRMAKFHGEGEP